MRGMKLPRFKLRTLLLLIAAFAIALSWTVYQLEWIRKRRDFFEHNVPRAQVLRGKPPKRAAPWSLRLFGEKRPYADGPVTMWVAESKIQMAKELFPEADFVVLDENGKPVILPR